jgi:hypothetical protein
MGNRTTPTFRCLGDDDIFEVDRYQARTVLCDLETGGDSTSEPLKVNDYMPDACSAVPDDPGLGRGRSTTSRLARLHRGAAMRFVDIA